MGYNFEMLFPEDLPEDLRESIEEFIKTPYWPGLLERSVVLHRAKLHYIPVIEITAINGEVKSGEYWLWPYRSMLEGYSIGRLFWWRDEDEETFESLKKKVEVKRRKCEIDGYFHIYWPANVFELDEVKAEMELMKSDMFLRLDNEEDVKLAKAVGLWHDGEFNVKYEPEYKDRLDKMSEEEKNRAIWGFVIYFARYDVSGYERVLNAYRKFNKQFWFAFSYLD